MIIILIAYFALLWAVTRRRKGAAGDGNDAFFRGNRRSPWFMVAFGMVGASVSGVSFVSVPGMVEAQDMTYLQTCMGFVLGYAIVAFVLLPIYYRLNLTSIYTLLQSRLGDGAYRVGTWFFMVSEMVGTVVKFYLVCAVLQRFVFDDAGIPFVVTVPLLVACIWIYTRHGGVRTLVLTDVLQTVCMVAALALIIWTAGALCQTPLAELPHTRVFEFDDWGSTQHFWRQFISGAFIVVVMTGLNQNMMQKNLTCRTLRDAQKDMCLSGLLFLPVNAMLLLLGAILLAVGVEASGDSLLPTFVASLGEGGSVASIPIPYYIIKGAFVLGIVSAAFSSADSSLTALTTSYCVDVARRPGDERLRRCVHVAMAAVLTLLVYLLQMAGSKSLIDLVYTLVGYTYGPLLGLFALALLPPRSKAHSKIPATVSGDYAARTQGPKPLSTIVVAPVCLLSPAVSYLVSLHVTLGYELLIINALVTFIPLFLLTRVRK